MKSRQRQRKAGRQNLISWIMFQTRCLANLGWWEGRRVLDITAVSLRQCFPKQVCKPMCVCWGRWVPGSKKSGRHGRHATLPSWGITVHTAPDRLWETLQWRKLVTVWPRTFSFQSTQWRHQESQVILECGVSPSSQVNDTPRTGFPPRHVQCSFYKHVLEHYLKAAVFAL